MLHILAIKFKNIVGKLTHEHNIMNLIESWIGWIIIKISSPAGNTLMSESVSLGQKKKKKELNIKDYVARLMEEERKQKEEEKIKQKKFKKKFNKKRMK